MKKMIVLIFLWIPFTFSSAQESKEKVMEKRAREMYRVIGLDDKEQWKKFISENYTQALIDKPMTVKVEQSESDRSSASTKDTMAGVEEKSMMFQQLHSDFGASKLASLTTASQTVDMVLENKSGLRGIFKLTFEDKSPYLIRGIGIEAN